MVAAFPQFVNISDCLGLWKARQGHHLKTQRAQNQWALEKRQIEVHERSHIKDKESIHFLLNGICLCHMTRFRISNRYLFEPGFSLLDPASTSLTVLLVQHTNPSFAGREHQHVTAQTDQCQGRCGIGGSSPSMEVFINKINKTSSCEG